LSKLKKKKRGVRNGEHAVRGWGRKEAAASWGGWKRNSTDQKTKTVKRGKDKRSSPNAAESQRVGSFGGVTQSNGSTSSTKSRGGPRTGWGQREKKSSWNVNTTAFSRVP